MRAFCAKAESLEKNLFCKTRVAVPSRLSLTSDRVRQTWRRLYSQVTVYHLVAGDIAALSCSAVAFACGSMVPLLCH